VSALDPTTSCWRCGYVHDASSAADGTDRQPGSRRHSRVGRARLAPAVRYDDGQALEDNDGPEPIRALLWGCAGSLIIWAILGLIAWAWLR
jgi:hypothetical protein